MAAERLRLSSILPLAWMGFCRGPWRCIGLTAVALSSATGLGLLAAELQASTNPWMRHGGDALWLMSFATPLLPLLALLRLADNLLSGTAAETPLKAERPLPWLLRQSLALVVMETLILLGGATTIRGIFNLLIKHSGVLAALSATIGSGILLTWALSQLLALPLMIHHGHQPLAAMEHSRSLTRHNLVKVLALAGLLIGLNLLGLMGACLGLLLSLPLSGMVLMASCRTQTP